MLTRTTIKPPRQNTVTSRAHESSILQRQSRQTQTVHQQETPSSPNGDPGFNFANISVLAPATAQHCSTFPDQAGDKFEQQADQFAEQIIRIPEPVIQRQEFVEQNRPHQDTSRSSLALTPGFCQGQRGPVSGQTNSHIQRQSATSPGYTPAITSVIARGVHALRSRGQPLAPAVRGFMEPRFACDFSQVRILTDSRAAKLSKQLNAKAFTLGPNIAFGAGNYQPNSPAGQKLLAHELTHVVQQGNTPGLMGKVQRKIVPEDVALEMIGREFELTAAFSAFGAKLKPGDKVTVLSWVNASETVSVFGGGALVPFMVPKKLLKPVRTAATGVAPYSAGVAGQAAVVEKSEKELAAWVAKESSFKTKKAVALFKAERKRLEGLLSTKRSVLNKKLIQETMFNRFDGIIKKEVNAANKAHGLSGKTALDPNLFKSMLFQETQLGTAGTHLEVPPSHPVKSRFNLGQVIDSSGMALLTLLEKEQPGLIAATLPTMRKDLTDAQAERTKLKKKSTLTSAEQVRLAELDGLATQNWEVFIWRYTSPGVPFRFADVVNAFFSSSSPALNLDYEFWIHMAVMWLFEKHTPGRSWPETIRAYNGSGARARHYRDAIAKRAKDAAAAEKAGKDFIPGKI